MGWQHDFCMDNAAFAGVVMGHSVPFVCQLFAASVGGCGNGGLALAPADYADITMVNSYGYHLPDRIIKPAKMVQTPTAGVLFLWVCRDSREAAQGVQPLVAAKPPYRSAGKVPCAEISPRQSAHARKGV